MDLLLSDIPLMLSVIPVRQDGCKSLAPPLNAILTTIFHAVFNAFLCLLSSHIHLIIPHVSPVSQHVSLCLPVELVSFRQSALVCITSYLVFSLPKHDCVCCCHFSDCLIE